MRDDAQPKSSPVRHTIAVRWVDELTYDDVLAMRQAVRLKASFRAIAVMDELLVEIAREEYEELDEEDKAECDRIDREREQARERQRRRREKGRATP